MKVTRKTTVSLVVDTVVNDQQETSKKSKRIRSTIRENATRTGMTTQMKSEEKKLKWLDSLSNKHRPSTAKFMVLLRTSAAPSTNKLHIRPRSSF
jgi:hypothetical protein